MILDGEIYKNPLKLKDVICPAVADADIFGGGGAGFAFTGAATIDVAGTGAALPPPPATFALDVLLAGFLPMETLGTTGALITALPGAGGGGIAVFAPARAGGAVGQNFEGGAPLRFMMNHRHLEKDPVWKLIT